MDQEPDHLSTDPIMSWQRSQPENKYRRPDSCGHDLSCLSNPLPKWHDIVLLLAALVIESRGLSGSSAEVEGLLSARLRSKRTRGFGQRET